MSCFSLQRLEESIAKGNAEVEELKQMNSKYQSERYFVNDCLFFVSRWIISSFREKLEVELKGLINAAPEIIDGESQTDNHQYEETIQMNNKMKDKMEQIVTERSELFEGVGEETNDRVDHLISLVENQREYEKIESQLRREIDELKRYLLFLGSSQLI